MADETKVLLKSPPHTPRPELWSITDAKLEGKYGECHFDDKRVEIHNDLSLPDLLETLGHETGHLTFPDLNERAIKRLGKNLATVLLCNPRLKITLVEGP
jgi:hypothetical protein